MWHGVSRLKRGIRFALGVIYHDSQWHLVELTTQASPDLQITGTGTLVPATGTSGPLRMGTLIDKFNPTIPRERGNNVLFRLNVFLAV